MGRCVDVKKIIVIVLLCSLLLLCFSGCAVPDEGEVKGPVELQSRDALVCTLVKYLHDCRFDYDLPGTSTAIKIEEIKNGKQAIHVGFDPSDCYFVCAYYDGAHEDEGIFYCCVTEYTWVKFGDVNEISEKYKDLTFVVAFQINRALFATDMIEKRAAVPDMEHYQKYVPEFCNGLNVSAPISFDTSFIYLNSSDDKSVYHSVFAYDHVLKTLPCISFRERYYFTCELSVLYPDGRRWENDFSYDFGKYYDSLTRVMDTDSYHVTNEQGCTIFYGLIEIDDFAECIS